MPTCFKMNGKITSLKKEVFLRNKAIFGDNQKWDIIPQKKLKITVVNDQRQTSHICSRSAQTSVNGKWKYRIAIAHGK